MNILKYGGLSILMIVLMFWGMPDFIVYSKYLIIIPIGLLLILIIPLQYFFTSLSLSENLSKSFSYLAIPIIGITLGFHYEHRSHDDLQINGQTTKGIIVVRFYQLGKSSGWLVQSRFPANNRYYQTRSITDKKGLKIGDTVDIIYSVRSPDNSEIYELLGNDDKEKFSKFIH
jgi:hypothetical protein